MYQQLPSKFDFTQYYLNQAAGGPSFPVYRARQRGGSFLSPLIRRHGIPFLKWIGKQAASLAAGIGTSYLNKGSVSKDEMKQIFKKQGKEAAHSVLDRMKQQVGSGIMTHRRDARLSTLIPLGTQQRDGMLTNQHMIRQPFPAAAKNWFSQPSSSGRGGKKSGRKNTGGGKNLIQVIKHRRKIKARKKEEPNRVKKEKDQVGNKQQEEVSQN